MLERAKKTQSRSTFQTEIDVFLNIKRIKGYGVSASIEDQL